MKLSYWVAPVKNDNQCYSIRAKTKKEVLAILERTELTQFHETPRRVEVEYRDAFDLMNACMSGDIRGDWEC